MDAVFHPRCLEDPHVFKQEGWHYELDSADAEMQYKGVVFNEMKVRLRLHQHKHCKTL